MTRPAVRLGCVLVAALLGVRLPLEGQPPPPPSFNKDVAPIVLRNCAVCHRPGEAGPFSLLTYQDVRSHARQIVQVTASRYMPPWLPAPGKADLAGERRLSDAEIATIRSWVETGAAEGDPADRPPPPRFTEGWQLGEPDLVLVPSRPFALRPDGPDVFWNLVYESPVSTTRYVRGMELRMDRRVVHHANLLIDRTRAARRLDAREPEPGFPGMELTTESEGFDPESHFLFWKPGGVPAFEPSGMAWRIDRETDLVLNLHLRPSGKPEAVAPAIGLYFTSEAPRLHPMLVQLEHDGGLDIPPGAKRFVVTDEYVLPVAAELLGIYPHAHYLGKELEAFATLPDGTRRWLIHIPDWDVNWQGVYRYHEPPLLPRGTTLSMRWSYDNSAENVRNPSQPPRRVRAGNAATDEMAHLWLQLLPRQEGSGKTDPRLLLQEALMRRRLVKYPGDFTAHYNLGAALEAQGRLEEAVRELQAAVRANPAHATARNTLGSAFEAQGRRELAAREYREALRIDPGYASAHYNLGRLLLEEGHTEDAIDHYRAAARIEPGDAALQAQLGAALQQAGRLAEAIEQARKALALDPGLESARYNLGRALLESGDANGAVGELGEAVRLRPDDPDARFALGVALATLGRSDEAVAAFRDALRLRPDDPAAHDALGQLLLASGALDEAIEHLRAGLRQRPDDADACSNLGSALAMKGDLVGARQAFERALAIDPSHAAATAHLARLRAQPKPSGRR